MGETWQDYDGFAAKFVDLTESMSKAEIRNLIISRLRTVTWGALSNKTK
jgi:hypothetical protein